MLYRRTRGASPAQIPIPGGLRPLKERQRPWRDEAPAWPTDLSETKKKARRSRRRPIHRPPSTAPHSSELPSFPFGFKQTPPPLR